MKKLTNYFTDTKQSGSAYFKALLMVVFIFATVLLAQRAKAWSPKTGTVPMLTNVIMGPTTNNAATNAAGYPAAITVEQGAGLNITVYYTQTNNGTSNAWIGFDSTSDGTGWTSYYATNGTLINPQFMFTNALAGSNFTTAMTFQLWPSNLLNIQQLRLDYWGTQATNNLGVAVTYNFFH